MQDKFQEIMGLVEKLYEDSQHLGRMDYLYMDETNDDERCECVKIQTEIQSKLRELVREPLSDSQINSMDCVLLDFEGDGSRQISSRSVREFARAIERAHGITQEKKI
jgi:hypothetical protein